jgi:uncharacterized membrane protein YdbT with pleckstrin-like domain
MKPIVFTQIAALLILGSLAEARIETPGSVTTGPFHHAAAVAHQNLRQNRSKTQAQTSKEGSKETEEKDQAKEKQPLRKRIFGHRAAGKTK